MLSSKPAGSVIDVNEEQPLKAPLPRLVRLAGSSIDVNKPEQGAVLEGKLTEAREAGGQLDRRQ